MNIQIKYLNDMDSDQVKDKDKKQPIEATEDIKK